MPDGAIPLPQAQSQQQQQTAASGIDVLNSLIKQRNTLSEDVSGLSKVAAVPIAGPGAGTSPALAIGQVPAFQATPFINKQTVGAKSTKDQGIANTMISVANVVGQYEEKANKEKQRVLAVDIERIMQAQDGMNQAKQALQLDPNNADAKAAYQKNSGIVDAMLSDPKRRKSISKAMDISFTDPSQNNSPEHGAMQEAAKSFSQQLMDKTPTQMQPNVQAQQQLALKMAQQKSVDDMIGKIAPTLVREQGADERQQRALDQKVAITEYQEKNRSARAQLAADERYKAVIAGANIHKSALLSATAMRNQAADSRLDKILKNRTDLLTQKQSDPITQAKVLGQNMQEMERFSKGLNDQNKTLIAQKQQLMVAVNNNQMSKKDAKVKAEALDQMIEANDHTIKYYSDWHKQTGDYVQNLVKAAKGGDSSVSRPSSESGNDNSTEVPKVGDTEDTDDTDLDPDDY